MATTAEPSEHLSARKMLPAMRKSARFVEKPMERLIWIFTMAERVCLPAESQSSTAFLTPYTKSQTPSCASERVAPRSWPKLLRRSLRPPSPLHFSRRLFEPWLQRRHAVSGQSDINELWTRGNGDDAGKDGAVLTRGGSCSRRAVAVAPPQQAPSASPPPETSRSSWR
jgi:hypothetical protein